MVVEHDEDMMRQSDYIVDMGPKAGRLGGNVVFQGRIDEMLKTDTLSAGYLNKKLSIPIPESWILITKSFLYNVIVNVDHHIVCRWCK